MSNASKGRKSKAARPNTKSKAGGLNPNQPYDGAYGNPRLVHVLLSLMGKKCQTKVRNGGVYEGIFHTFNPKMDIALDVVHKLAVSDDQSASTNGLDVLPAEGDCPKEEELIGNVIFQTDKLVSVHFEDVDLSFAELDVNETNGDIVNQSRPYSKGGEKKLEPWNGGGDALEDEEGHVGGLEDMVSSDGTNGWGAAEMFKANEEKYGVKSDYDSSLSNYTMALDIKDTEEDSERVARATRMAQEIESSSDYRQRVDLELDEGRTDEDKFSAVVRERDRRDGRDSREMRERDREHNRDFRDRDKDRGDLRDRDRDPISPQGFRNFDRYSGNRNRGRGRESWDKRNQQGYSSPNTGPSRSMGSGGPSSGGRSQPNIPPRFTKTGSGGHSNSAQRDDDRMRPHNDSAMHHGFQQQPKGQRQPRIMRSNAGGNRSWGPMSPPSSEYSHHSPTSQMHQDPAVISASPAGGPPPSLSRTSSSSSNTSAPAQGYNQRKQSGQDDVPMQHGPPQGPHPQHSRQPSSPTTGPMHNANQMQMQRSQAMAQSTAPSLPGKDASWSSIVSGNAAGQKQQMGPGSGEMPQQSPVHPGSRIPQPAHGHRMPGAIHGIHVKQNATYTWTPRGGTPPITNRNPPMGSPRSQPRPPMHGMGAEHGPMVSHPPQQMVISPQQHAMPQQQQALVAAQSQVAQPPVKQQPAMKMPGNPPSEPVRHPVEKSEDNKNINKTKDSSEASSMGTKEKIAEDLKDFSKHFHLKTTDVRKEGIGQPPGQPNMQQSPVPGGQRSQPNRMNMRGPANMPQAHPGQPRAASYPNTAPQQQTYPQNSPQTYAGSMPPVGQGTVAPHGMSQVPNQMPGNTVQPNKPMQQQPSNMNHSLQPVLLPMSQQIPMAAADIKSFAGNVLPPNATQLPQSAMKSPRTPEGGQQTMVRTIPQGGEKGGPSPQQKPMTSPKQDMPNYPANVNVVTGQTTPQANPSAVNTVSAASASAIVSSHFPSPVAANQIMQTQRESPNAAPNASQSGPAPSADSKVAPVPTTPTGNLSAVTSPTSTNKALNPEAPSFTPRTPAKPAQAAAVAPRTPTPQHMVYLQPSANPQYQQVQPMPGGMGPQATGQLTQVYNPAQVQQHIQVDQPQMQTYQISPGGFPQQFQQVQQPLFLPQPPHVMQAPQGMQSFTTFENPGVYTGPAQNTMMTPNTRVAIPTTPQHMQQYQNEQTHSAMYVTQTNFMPGARPHSAHTPTQVHVTSTSPANPTQQQQPPAAHPGQGMTPTHGVPQPQMWMSPNPSFVVLPGGPNTQHLQPNMPQPPQATQAYLNTMQAQIPTTMGISSVTPQQKGQAQAIAAAHVLTSNPRPFPGQYQNQAPANQ